MCQWKKSLTKPLISADVKLSREREKTIAMLGFRWVLTNCKWMTVDGGNAGEIKFSLIYFEILKNQFKVKLNVRARSLNMDIPGKHILSGESDRRFTNVVEKNWFFDEVYELDDSLERDFVLNFNTLEEYQKLKEDPNFDPAHDVEVFVSVTIEATKNTWKFLKPEFMKHIDLESADLPHNKILIVGDKRFYVQSQLLISLSDYFKTLFSIQDQTEVEIKDVDPVVFHDLLKMIYQVDYVIGASNVVDLYKMASFFEVPSVFDICSMYLADESNEALPHIMQYIKLADEYKDGKLLMVYFRKLKNGMGAAAARAFAEAFQPKIQELSRETQIKLDYWLKLVDPMDYFAELFQRMNRHHH